MITVPPLSDEGASRRSWYPARTLVRIIKPRVEEILELVRDRLTYSPLAAEPTPPGHAHRRREPAHRPCRIWPRAFSAVRSASDARSALPALPDVAKGAAFAVAAGLLVYPQFADLEHFEPRRRRH